MKALKHILIWTALLGLRAASAQDLVADLTPPAERGAASFEVWANQRTNAFTSGFVHTAQQGDSCRGNSCRTCSMPTPCSEAWEGKWGGPSDSARVPSATVPGP